VIRLVELIVGSDRTTDRINIELAAGGAVQADRGVRVGPARCLLALRRRRRRSSSSSSSNQ